MYIREKPGLPASVGLDWFSLLIKCHWGFSDGIKNL